LCGSCMNKWIQCCFRMDLLNFLMDTFFTVLDIHAKSIFLWRSVKNYTEICVDLVLINVSNGSLWFSMNFLLWINVTCTWIYGYTLQFCGSIVDC
jgi:hypothetical protein